MNWLIRVPLIPLTVVAIVLALAPFTPEPHLWQKLKMLLAGELVKPIDIFDLLMHGTPIGLLLIRLIVMAKQRAK